MATKNNGKYRVGVHIADVTCFVEKGSHVDCEAYERATTFYPGQGRNPYHMLPGPLSTRCCSLLPVSKKSSSSSLFVCGGT
jgi:ribonuclease R